MKKIQPKNCHHLKNSPNAFPCVLNALQYDNPPRRLTFMHDLT